ncbi:MAG: hypothetical protein KBE96_07330 [Bacteroidales bacterium]|nr:hypothetical protein [Bacteroidales bacterium]
MKNLSLGLLSLIISSLSLNAQSDEYFKSFMEEADINSVIYRGNAPFSYHFKHEGSYYLINEKFHTGSIIFNGKKYTDVEINLNCHIDELIIKIPESISTVIVNKEFVNSFNIAGKNFIYYNSFNSLSPESGYYQLQYSGRDTLLKKVKKIYVEEIPQSATSGTLRRIFKHEENFHIYTDGKWNKAANRRDLIKIYPQIKKEIKRFIRESKLNFTNDKDNSILEVVKFAEINNLRKR